YNQKVAIFPYDPKVDQE
ncbi:hypothetical protein CP8484711_0749B, partial [Chlamydia psittaci 84-8471/1]